MIDYFSLILGHVLLTITIFKVMMHDDAEPPVSGPDQAEDAGRGKGTARR